MVKKLIPLWCTFTLVVFLFSSIPMFTQEGSNQQKAGKARWEGIVVRSSPDKSELTVREQQPKGLEKVIYYDSSTRWVSQEHGSKKANDIDPSQVKDGDRVIVQGTEEGGKFHARVISKRLTPRQ